MAETLKALFQHPEENRKPRKDKLAENKKQEAMLREALKAEKEEAKDRRSEETHAASEVYRMERAWNPVPSKRAQRDARAAARHEAKIGEGQTCEHGIWKCRICFPHKTDK